MSEGGPMCSLFATTYPEKTRALIMIGTYAKRLWAPDYPVGADQGGARALPRRDPQRLGRPGGHRSARAEPRRRPRVP